MNYWSHGWELVWCVSCFALPRSLSSTIDPGMTFRPCIALTTEDRSRMFNRRYRAGTCKKVQFRDVVFFGCNLLLSPLFWIPHTMTLDVQKHFSEAHRPHQWQRSFGCKKLSISTEWNLYDMMLCRGFLLAVVRRWTARLCNASRESFSSFQWTGMCVCERWGWSSLTHSTKFICRLFFSGKMKHPATTAWQNNNLILRLKHFWFYSMWVVQNLMYNNTFALRRTILSYVRFLLRVDVAGVGFYFSFLHSTYFFFLGIFLENKWSFAPFVMLQVQYWRDSQKYVTLMEQ